MTVKHFVFCFLFLLFAPWNGWATTNNIAPLAHVKTSSDKDADHNGQKATDGLIGIDGKGEWVSASKEWTWGDTEFPWIQLTWDKPHIINKVVVYDLPTLASHTAAGTLVFSDGSQVKVNMIPNNGQARAVEFDERETEWVKFVITDGDGSNLGLSEIEVFPSINDENVDHVGTCNPYIETARGRYFFFVTGSQPFGMISAAPLTRNKNQGGGGYNYNSLEILGFPQIHAWMLSGLNFMPTTGTVEPWHGEQAWKSPFSHDSEVVQPGYHRVYLDRYGVWVEQTATDRVSMYRLRFTRKDMANLMLSLGGYVATTTMNDCEVRRVSDTELEGSFNTTGRLWGGPEDVRVFFVMQFDKPFSRLDAWNDKAMLKDVKAHRGAKEKTKRHDDYFSYYDAPAAGVSAVYPVEAGEEVQVKFSISYTSIANARNNMKTDTGSAGWDFDAVRHHAQTEWNDWFGRIDVKGGTSAQRMKFYTDLWHVLLGRHKIDDASGDYPDYTQGGKRRDNHVIGAKLNVRSIAKGKDGKPRHHMYNSDSFWLSQWNLNIIWGLAWPEVLDDMAACLVQYDANGGLLPRGPNAGGYSYIMDGCPATNLIVSAYQKDMLTKVSAEKAYRAMVRNHQPGGMLGGKAEIDYYIKHGYVPGNAGTTVEAAFQDWSLGQMAQRMGKKKDAAYYDRRSHGWTALFNKEVNLVMPKDDKGNWLHNDPLNGWGWMEANAWQATWSLSHDLPRLAKLMGGYDKMCEMLNFAFEQSEEENFVSGYGNGYVSYANQPGLSNAHVFNFLGKPWLSQYWVRKVKEQAYGGITPDCGYGGHDEDQGQMGATSALMGIGLFSLQGTNSVEPQYELTSPIFDEVTITLDPRYYQGKKFIIRTHNNSATNCYIKSATLNDKSLTEPVILHKDLGKGGVLDITLGKEATPFWQKAKK
jgi:predicted alpha-1,2-mannosidase